MDEYEKTVLKVNPYVTRLLDLGFKKSQIAMYVYGPDQQKAQAGWVQVNKWCKGFVQPNPKKHERILEAMLRDYEEGKILPARITPTFNREAFSK